MVWKGLHVKSGEGSIWRQCWVGLTGRKLGCQELEGSQAGGPQPTLVGTGQAIRGHVKVYLNGCAVHKDSITNTHG